MAQTQTRYNVSSVHKMMEQLQGWIEQSEETLSNEESRDYPNDEHIDALQERIDALQQAFDALESIG